MEDETLEEIIGDTPADAGAEGQEPSPEEPEKTEDGSGTLPTEEGKPKDGKEKNPNLVQRLRKLAETQAKKIAVLEKSAPSGQPLSPDVVAKVERIALREELSEKAPHLVASADAILAAQKRYGMSTDEAIAFHVGQQLVETASKSGTTTPNRTVGTPTFTQDLRKLPDDELERVARQAMEQLGRSVRE